MLGAPLRQPKRPQPARLRMVTVPAPIGGLNTVDAGAAMPTTDAVLLYNMVAAEYGLRTRLGYREWCTGLGYPTRTVWAPSTVYAANSYVINGPNVYKTTAGGTSAASPALGPGYTAGADGTVADWVAQPAVAARSVLPFTGSAKSGANNKLFVATIDGIYDCSSSTQTPARVVAFATNSSDSGFGTSTVFVNSAGKHFLLYCDEENGYFVYTESNTTWATVALQASTAWAQGTVYAAGARVYCNGASYKTTAGGTSAASGTGPSGNTTGIVDNTVTWDYEPSVSGKDPSKFASVTVWANRVWFVEKDTANAWYTSIGSLFGAVTQFSFGSRFRAGGDLRQLINWTLDGGAGATNSLVAVSGGGDVAIYQGTDPAQVATFALKGTWSLGGGAVPLGRRLATDHGGDVLVATTIGVVPLSKLVMGVPASDKALYETTKIANTFGQAAYTNRTSRGWWVRLHPADNTLLVNVPQADGTTLQFAQSLTQKSWSLYRDIPASYCADAWNGDLYLGTNDGRVVVNSGYLDGITLYAPAVSTPIQWEVMTAFQTLGRPTKKKVALLRPSLMSQGGAPSFVAAARFDYDLTELGVVSVGAGAGGNSWDSAVWDSSVWGGDWSATSIPSGAAGCGCAVAVIVRGTATSRTSLVGIDVALEEGGML